MPLMSNKRRDANGDYVTGFTSVAYTGGETYSFSDTNNRLSIRNCNASTLTLTLNGNVYTILPFKSILLTESYTQFTISSNVNSSAFEVMSIIDNADDPQLELDSVISQLNDIAIQTDSYTGTDTVKLQNAINSSAGKTLKLKDNTTYIIDAPLVGVSNIKIVGKDSVIKVKDNTRILSIFNFNNKANIKFDGVIFDMNIQNMPVYLLADYPNAYNTPIYADYSSNIEIKNCKFINLYTKSIELLHSSGYIKIKDNYFSSPIQAQNQILDHISFTTMSIGNIEIINNFIDNAPYTNQAFGINGVFMAGVTCPTLIQGNTLNYCGRDNTGGHRLNPIDFYGNCKNIKVLDNDIVSVFGCCRMNSCQYIDFKNNRVKFTKGSSENAVLINSQVFYGVNCETKDINIEENTFASLTTEDVFLIQVATEDWGLKSIGVNFNNNKLFGKFKTVFACYVPFNSVFMKSNSIVADESNNSADIIFKVSRLTTLTTTLDVEINSSAIGLEICDNIIPKTKGANSIDLSTFTGTKGVVKVDGNEIIGDSTQTAILTAHTVPIHMTNNYFSGSTYNYYIRGNLRAYLLNNISEIFGTSACLIDGTVLITKANNYGNGVLF